MRARKIILLTFIIGFGLLLCNSVSALPRYQLNREYAIESHDGALLEQHPVSEYGYSRKKPTFPSPEERKKITKRRRVLNRYPQISIIGGVLFRSQNNTKLDETFGRLESGYGFMSGDRFSCNLFSATFGMRLYVMRELCLAAEYSPGGNGMVHLLSIGGLYSVYQKKDISVSIGFARAMQRLQAEREYSYRLDSGSPYGSQPVTLQKIHIDTGEQDGWLFSVVLDVWGRIIGRTTGFFLAINYIDAPVVRDKIYLPYQTDMTELPKLEVSMSGWYINAGLTFTFQI
jgi:hypothetical protein